MRKTFFISALFAVTAMASVAHAQGFIPLAPIPGLTEGVTANQAGLANFLNNLYKYLIGLAAVIAVVEIIWGGLLYSTQDVPGSKTNGKEKIQNALLGLVLVLSPVLVFSIINPSILNLSISLPKLDTRSGGGGTPVQTTQPVTLSDTQIQDRESSGGKVLYAFTLDSSQQNASPIQVRNILNSEQTACTAAPGGPGIILPDSRASEGGGSFNYVCQTCPSNTTLTLFSTCSIEKKICGSCLPK